MGNWKSELTFKSLSKSTVPVSARRRWNKHWRTSYLCTVRCIYYRLILWSKTWIRMPAKLIHVICRKLHWIEGYCRQFLSTESDNNNGDQGYNTRLIITKDCTNYFWTSLLFIGNWKCGGIPNWAIFKVWCGSKGFPIKQMNISVSIVFKLFIFIKTTKTPSHFEHLKLHCDISSLNSKHF